MYANRSCVQTWLSLQSIGSANNVEADRTSTARSILLINKSFPAENLYPGRKDVKAKTAPATMRQRPAPNALPCAPMARILVTNDDGIYSEGLRRLADACRRIDGVE